MASKPRTKLEPDQLKNLTVNRLPKALVLDFKAMVIRLETTIEDLMQLALADAVKKGDGFAIDVARLRIQRKLDKKHRAAAESELKKIIPKVEASDAAN
jgi:hypothetical protein